MRKYRILAKTEENYKGFKTTVYPQYLDLKQVKEDKAKMKNDLITFFICLILIIIIFKWLTFISSCVLCLLPLAIIFICISFMLILNKNKETFNFFFEDADWGEHHKIKFKTVKEAEKFIREEEQKIKNPIFKIPVVLNGETN